MMIESMMIPMNQSNQFFFFLECIETNKNKKKFLLAIFFEENQSNA